MAATPASEPRLPRRKALYESRREREFYRYYEPIRELTGTGPPLCDLHDAKAVEAHMPSASPDRALTAFCQLGALRLGARRAMLFFFDSNHAYILAEATQTLSLLDESVHDVQDSLWLGHSMIPRGFSVCEHTVNLPANLGSNRNEDSADIVHIINDLTGDTRFCDRPYVKGGPLARFYAGVPITTPKGLNIGAYCIVDDKPRDGLDQKGVSFLVDMATTIMTHLEMVRHTADHRRSSRMVSGLSAFVDGASGLRNMCRKGSAHRTRKATAVHAPSEQANSAPAAQDSTALPNGRFNTDSEQERRESAHNGTDIKHSRTSSRRMSDRSGQSPSQNTQRPMNSVTADSKSGEDLREQLVHPNVKATFERVAHVVREAVEVDAALFLDATVVSYAGLVNGSTQQSSSEHTSDWTSSGSEAVPTASEGQCRARTSSDDLDGEPCVALGSSVAPGFELDAAAVISSKRTVSVSEKFLHTLLRKYPRGKIWNFNEEGDASSEDDSSGSSSSHGNEHALSHDSTAKQLRKRRRKRARIDDGREIQRLFPGVRSLALVGMWDPMKARYFSGCVVWTYSSQRLLSEQSELNFMTAFCDAVMAEVHRLEASNADNAKMDFISSISHELRSPLHGILGSVECLQEQVHDATNGGLISQVEVCARTLLDIVNHLLDFSKINNYARAQKRSMTSHSGRQHVAEIAKTTSRVGGKMILDADVSLDVTTEEVIETAFYSYCWSKEQQTILDRNVAFILDIDRSPEADWRCRIATGGWKRICINLVSNALKYTTQGYVHVALKYAPLRHRKKFNAILTVSDTGRGMSQDFLVNHLFRAFSQEDSHIEGTGLGMSLVAKIVKALGGKVDVKSTKGVGTTITVTVPLQHNPKEADIPVLNDYIHLKDLLVGLIQLGASTTRELDQTPVERGQTTLRTSLKRTCSELGLSFRTLDLSTSEGADVVFILESDLLLIQALADEAPSDAPVFPQRLVHAPWIVLCSNAISERQIRTNRPVWLSASNVEFVSLPAGPNRLRSRIESSLRSNSNADATQLSDEKVSRLDTALIAEMAQQDLSIPLRPSSRAVQATRKHRRWMSDSVAYFPEEAAEVSIKTIEKVERPQMTVAEKTVEPSIEPSFMVTDSTVNRQRIEPTPTSPTETHRNLSLLLVDDNQINLQLLVTYANKRKYHNLTATNGLEALEAYKAACMKLNMQNSRTTEIITAEPAKPQVVLMDINMPVLDGFEATRQIRQFERDCRVEPATVIALTGLGSADAQQEAYGSGIDLFLTKPVRLKELTRILEELQRS